LVSAAVSLRGFTSRQTYKSTLHLFVLTAIHGSFIQLIFIVGFFIAIEIRFSIATILFIVICTTKA